FRKLSIPPGVSADAIHYFPVQGRLSFEQPVKPLFKPFAQRRRSECQSQNQYSLDYTGAYSKPRMHPLANYANAIKVNREHYRREGRDYQAFFDDELEVAIAIDVVRQQS